MKLIIQRWLCCLGICCSLQATAQTVTPARPNILWIITDQQTAQAMSVAGNKELHTPAMDRLAARGVRFTRAYCAQPLCTPSRISMFSGRMPHQMQLTTNASDKENRWPDTVMMAGRLMKAAGYRTGYVGKWHIPLLTTDSARHGFQYMKNIQMRDWMDASTPADCAAFMKQNSRQPFFLIASFVNPHDICEWARGDDMKMDMLPPMPDSSHWPGLPANFEIPQREPPVVREQQHSNYRTYPTLQWKPEQWRAYRWAYNRLTEQVDQYVGMVLETLRKYKLEDNTIVIFTSDHGDGYAAHRWNQKQVLYEESASVPLIIAGPGVGAGVTNDQLVCNGTDILPTLCDYAGAPKPGYLAGRSLQPLLNGRHQHLRDTLVIATTFADNEKSLDIDGRAVITARYKYIVYDSGPIREQLFDLQLDPGEMHSLATDKRFRSIQEQFRRYLRQWCVSNNDSFHPLKP